VGEFAAQLGGIGLLGELIDQLVARDHERMFEYYRGVPTRIASGDHR
jgi:hypothetical protein